MIPRTIAITGGAGVVGRALLPTLQKSYRVIALAHSDTQLPGVEVIRCDIAQPRFGLDPEKWAELASVTDVIVHSAATTAWGLPSERYIPVNIDGTRHVIELARLADASLQFVSSCFVLALESPRCEEILGSSNVVHPYLKSKREADRLVRQSGVPYNIHRPTNLVGDSGTGASSRPQIVQMMADWISRGKAPYIPGHPGNLVDVAPVDMVASAVAGSIEAADFGNEFWITYGSDSMTSEEAVAEIVDHARRLGRSVDTPPIVDPSSVLPEAIANVPAMSRAFLKVLVDVSNVTHACGGVLPSSLSTLRARYGASDISCSEAFRRSLNYWTAQRAEGT
jgi:nucleoside-diphosphate-sugar epimerase